MYLEMIYGTAVWVMIYLIASENISYKKFRFHNVLPLYHDDCFNNNHIAIVIDYSSQHELDSLV